jgi:PGF-pre-PGF domain-containing protein
MGHQGAVLVVMALLVLSVAACGIAIANEQAPGEPASFFGSANESDGDPIRKGETIVAVVDGDVRDEITVEPAGKYGDEAAFDEKLRVDSETGDEVVFRLADAGGPVGGSTALEAGVLEVNVTFPDGAHEYIAPEAVVTLDTTMVAPGETLSFSGANSSAHDDAAVVAYQWSIERGGNETATFEDEKATRSFEETGTREVELEITDDANRTSVVNETFEVASDDSSGSTGATTSGGTVSSGGGGATGGFGGTSADGGGSSSTDETRDNTSNKTGNRTEKTGRVNGIRSSTASIVEETARIDDNSSDAPGTAVAFNTPTIRRVVFENDGTSGNVTVREFNSTRNDGPPLPGSLRVIAASEITVSPDLRDEDATIQAVIDPELLPASSIDPSDLGVYRLPDDTDQWQALATTVNESDERIIVEAATPGFSWFVVAAPSESETPVDVTPAREAARPLKIADAMGRIAPGDPPDSPTETGLGVVRPVGALVVLLILIGGVGRILTPRRRGR